jgi:hypothetical protein
VALGRNGVSEESFASIFKAKRIRKVGTLAVIDVSLSSLMMEATCFSETTVLTRVIRRHIPEDGILVTDDSSK